MFNWAFHPLIHRHHHHPAHHLNKVKQRTLAYAWQSIQEKDKAWWTIFIVIYVVHPVTHTKKWKKGHAPHQPFTMLSIKAQRFYIKFFFFFFLHIFFQSKPKNHHVSTLSSCYSIAQICQSKCLGAWNEGTIHWRAYLPCHSHFLHLLLVQIVSTSRWDGYGHVGNRWQTIVNKIQLIGRIGADPTRTAVGDRHVTNYTVATSETRPDKEGGIDGELRYSGSTGETDCSMV